MSLQIAVPLEFNALAAEIAANAVKATAAKLIAEFELDAEEVDRFLGIELKTAKAPKAAKAAKAKPKKAKKAKKADSDDEEEVVKPKKSPTGYNLFMADPELRSVANQVLEERLEADGVLISVNKAGEQVESKVLMGKHTVGEQAKAWGKLGKLEKAEWITKAVELKEAMTIEV